MRGILLVYLHVTSLWPLHHMLFTFFHESCLHISLCFDLSFAWSFMDPLEKALFQIFGLCYTDFVFAMPFYLWSYIMFYKLIEWHPSIFSSTRIHIRQVPSTCTMPYTYHAHFSVRCKMSDWELIFFFSHLTIRVFWHDNYLRPWSTFIDTSINDWSLYNF